MTATTAAKKARREKSRNRHRAKTAEHRPAARKRRWSNDDVVAGDLFSGFGGITRGMEAAGVTTILAANHNRYKVEVHEANHPDAEHWVCDLVDPDAGDYHSPRDLPKVDWLAAGVSCVSHSGANAKRAYREGNSLFTYEDPEWEDRVTKSERDRATAVCVLQYADIHRPKIMFVECTTELTSWGPALPNRPKIGDGSTYKWWMKSVLKLGYKCKTLYLNSMFFGVPQSRDRLYLVFWLDILPTPDLEFRLPAWCGRCDQVVESVWTWRTGIPPSGRVRYGEQYHYVCPRCSQPVVPPRAPSIQALDLTNLGTRIGDRDRPLAATSMARIERCIERFKDFPAILMPTKSIRGVDRHPWQPMGTQTSQQETALVSTGALNVVAGNTFEHPGSECRTRDLADPLWTQHATNGVSLLTPPVAAVIPYRSGTHAALSTEPMPTQGALESMGVLAAGVVPLRTNAHITGVDEPTATVVGGAGSGGLGVVAAGVIPYRKHTIPNTHAEPMPAFTSEQIPGVLAAGVIVNNGKIDEAKYRARGVDQPFSGFTSSPTHSLLAAGFFKQNGQAHDTAPHPMSDPFNTLTSVDTTGLAIADWHQMLEGLTPDDCYYRMMLPPEVRDGCGFDRSFIVWGAARDQVDGYGNAVSPPVAYEISMRIKEIL